MADRITKNDLQAAFERHNAALHSIGAIPEGMQLGMDIGSKTYGRAYRLYMVGTDRTVEGWSGHRSPTVGSDFLGMTAREAYRELTTRTRVLHDTIRVLKDAGRIVKGN